MTEGWLMDLFVTAERTTATGCRVLQKGGRAERASSDQRGEQWDSEETYQSQPTALPVHGGPAGNPQITFSLPYNAIITWQAPCLD